jgi:hypothetical protein
VEIIGEALYISFGDVEAEGQTVPDTDAAGFHLSARVGVSVPIGG